MVTIALRAERPGRAMGNHPHAFRQRSHLFRCAGRLEVWWWQGAGFSRESEFGYHAFEATRKIEVHKARFLRVDTETVNVTCGNVGKRSRPGSDLCAPAINVI
jgi:hypothetical protein